MKPHDPLHFLQKTVNTEAVNFYKKLLTPKQLIMIYTLPRILSNITSMSQYKGLGKAKGSKSEGFKESEKKGFKDSRGQGVKWKRQKVGGLEG